MDSLKKRKPILAFLFSLVTPGLGQIYNGQFKKGVSYLVGFLLVYILFSFLLLKFYGMICYLIIMVGLFLFISLDALLGAIKSKTIVLKSYNRWYIYLIIFLLNSVVIRPLLGWTIKNNVARAYKIPSITMKPALLAGDHLIANMRIYKSGKPKRGDVIIFEYSEDPSKDFIKRVVGLESEKVEIINDKVYIKGKLLDDPWGYYESSGQVKDLKELENFGPVVVPENSLFVLGDNRNNSQDSRFWGFVDIRKVKGKALYLYWAKDKSRIAMELK